MQPTAARLVLALDHIAIDVLDPAAAAHWFEDHYGLTVAEDLGDELRLVCRPANAVVCPEQELTLFRGPRTALRYIAFLVRDETALDRLAERLVRNCVVFNRQEREIELTDGNGVMIRLRCPGPLRYRPPGAGVADLLRLGHVTLTVPQPDEAAEFYCRALGFEVSERDGHDFVWLRCNRDHHVIAFMRGPAGLHHLAFEVSDPRDLVGLSDSLIAAGVRIEFGPGRHTAGHNLFLYVIDAMGIRTEFFCQLARIDDYQSYRVVDWAQEQEIRSANAWGPTAPESFRASSAIPLTEYSSPRTIY